jgi:hypothetical protein
MEVHLWFFKGKYFPFQAKNLVDLYKNNNGFTGKNKTILN